MVRFISIDVVEEPDLDWYSHPETINIAAIVRFYDSAKHPDSGPTHAVVELRNGNVLTINESYESLKKRISDWDGGIA